MARVLSERAVMLLRVLSGIVILATVAGCGSSATAPSPAFTTTSQFFVNALSPGGTSLYTLAVSDKGFIGVTLASLVSASTGEPIQNTVVLGLGTPSGTTCTTTTSLTVAPALSAQINLPINPGNYCVSVTGTGLPGPVTFAARITVTSAEPPTSTATFIDSVSTAINNGGAMVHTFAAFRGGVSTVTMNALGSDKILRLGIGLWDGAVCRLMATVDTQTDTTPQLLAGVDAGTYCVSLRDVNLTGRTNFTITIARP